MTAATVRPEYEVLARDFGALVSGQFDLDVERGVQEELVLLCACFEAIDRHVDALEDAPARALMGSLVLGALEGGSPSELPCELVPLLGSLRLSLLRRGAVDPFVRALASFFASSEHLRTTRAVVAFVRCVLEEADRAADMTLLLVESLRSPRFERFFVVLSQVANLVDKLHDVRGDRRRGEIAVRPGLLLHVRLVVALVARVLHLLWLSPHPVHLATWGARYLA